MTNPDPRFAASEAFVECWADLLMSLPDDYACHMTCIEANLAADLLRAFGMTEHAEELIVAHAEHDEEGDLHYGQP